MAKKEMAGAQDVMPVDDIVEQQTTAADPVGKPDTQQKATYAGGKYKSVDDLEKGYLESQNKIAAQGAELGMAKKNQEDLLAAQQQPAKQAEAKPETNYEKAMQEIAQSVDDGDMEPGEGMRQTNELTAQMVAEKAQQQVDSILGKATQQFEQTLADRDQQAIVSDFNKQNPDFVEMKAAGAFEKYKAENPLHDDFSAYFAAKADVAKAQGMAEQAKIQAGSKDVEIVAATPGTAMQTQKQKPTGEAAIKKSMAAAWDTE